MNCLDAGDAERYCAWTGGRLPTEVEWLRAVFGDGSHPYPWGPSWEEGRANRGGGEPHEPGEAERAWAFTSPVGAFDSDRSVWGLLDGGGNVSEWVREPVSPLAVPPDREGDRDLHRRLRALAGGDEEPPEHRVLGASWADSAHTDGRLIAHVVRRDAVGFRCVRP